MASPRRHGRDVRPQPDLRSAGDKVRQEMLRAAVRRPPYDRGPRALRGGFRESGMRLDHRACGGRRRRDGRREEDQGPGPEGGDHHQPAGGRQHAGPLS